MSFSVSPGATANVPVTRAPAPPVLPLQAHWLPPPPAPMAAIVTLVTPAGTMNV